MYFLEDVISIFFFIFPLLLSAVHLSIFFIIFFNICIMPGRWFNIFLQTFFVLRRGCIWLQNYILTDSSWCSDSGNQLAEAEVSGGVRKQLMRAQTDARSFFIDWFFFFLTDEDLWQKQGWLFGLERLGQVHFKNNVEIKLLYKPLNSDWIQCRDQNT